MRKTNIKTNTISINDIEIIIPETIIEKLGRFAKGRNYKIICREILHTDSTIKQKFTVCQIQDGKEVYEETFTSLKKALKHYNKIDINIKYINTNYVSEYQRHLNRGGHP